MGLFGFGKKKREREEAEAKAENREDEAAVDTEETAAPTDVADTYEGRGESYGPWDVDDENVPDYDEYLDMGSYYLPYLAGLQLRIKANRSTQEILGATISYIVGVDGPRWMLRGIFSGKAANDDGNSDTEALNKYFADIVVERGDEPLAPRDLIPMHPPVTPAQRQAAAKTNDQADDKEHLDDIPDKPEGPFDSDQQTEVKTTLSRGPMFSEVR